jgi:D-tyrosyl-tRNA(Tyr) deacylase
VVQRVKRACVRVDGEVVGEIGAGLAVLVGVREEDTPADAHYIADKIANLRVLDAPEGRMDRSPLDEGAAILVVSQFTLFGDVRKGRRPSYSKAARGEAAEGLYEAVCSRLRGMGLKVATGRFGAMMAVELIGDGPVTILLDSERLF